MLGQLIRKELHLQKSNGLFALVVLLFWVALLIAVPFGDARIDSLYGVQVAELLVILETGFIGMCLAFVLPMSIGATLAAEERHAGVWDWALSLPGSRGKQWCVKVAVGMVLTAVLAWAVLPLVDAILFAALPDQSGSLPGEPPQGLARGLQRGIGLLLLPLVFFAAGAFASSQVSRSYQAFFLTIPIAALAIGAGRIADLGVLLGIPWSGEELAKNGLNGMARFYAILHVLATVGLLLWLASLNFRFDHFRKRRLSIELATLIVLVSVASGILFDLAINPEPLLSGRWEDAAPLIEWKRSKKWGEGLPPIDRERITPLMVARPNPPWWTGGVSLREKTLKFEFLPQPDSGNTDGEYVRLFRPEAGERGSIIGQTLRLNARTGEIRSFHGVGPEQALLAYVLPRISLTPLPLWNAIRVHREIARIVDEAPILKPETAVVGDRDGSELEVRDVECLSDSLPYCGASNTSLHLAILVRIFSTDALQTNTRGF